MSYEVTQLSQEEVVGEEVVLKDINPITNTNAVNDNTNGMKLDQTIQRLWNSINNKLSRVVNSVNGRTGVVVLNANDVGLGNVDNVSFTDIKKWVIDQIEQTFENKRLRLFDSFEQLDQLLSTNDETYKDTPYFIDELNQSDRRSYIGYIYYNENDKRLSYSHMAIDVIGYTDDSIIYNEKVGKDDLRGGGIGVNISCYEDALRVYHGATKDESGLMIDKNKIAGSFYSFDCVYGPLHPLLTTDPLSTNPLMQFAFVTNGNPTYVGSSFRVANDLKFGVNDLILCNFNSFITNSGTIPDGMDYRLMHRMPHIGKVMKAPSDDKPNQPYTVYFYSIETQLGWGMQYEKTHYSINNDNSNRVDKNLTLKLSNGHRYGFEDVYNVSGLQVLSGKYDLNTNTGTVIDKPSECFTIRSLPEGPIQCSDQLSDFGLQINTDMSLCVMPYNAYGYGSSEEAENIGIGSGIVDNWYTLAPSQLEDYQRILSSDKNDGVLYDTCLLGVNLNKIVKPSDSSEINPKAYKFTNLSGLRLVDPGTFVGGDLIGNYNPQDLAHITGHNMSGGLAINVGDCLEIGSCILPESMEKYYDTGKVNVRYGGGLTKTTDNKLVVDFGESESTYNPELTNHRRQGTGLAVDSTNGLQVADGYGIGFDSTGQTVVKKRILKITDSLGNGQAIHTTSESTEKGGDGLPEVVDIVFGDGLIVTFD